MAVRLLAYKRRLVKAHARRLVRAQVPSPDLAYRLLHSLGYVE